jgi:polysaccharide biosynthesis/export protein
MMRFAPLRSVGLAVCWLAGAIALATPTMGQTPRPVEEVEDPRAVRGTRTTIAAPVVTPPLTTLLDVPIERAEYRLGPGDILDLGLVGDVNELHRVTVTPEGAVMIPGVGVIAVRGLNIDEAETAIRAAVRRYYRTVEVNLTLSSVRQFRVFVVGNVPTAGVQVATSVTRVSELIEMDPRDPIPRNVVLRRVGGDSVRVDLARFVRAGDLSANPVVREGDVLVVPVADRFNDVVGSVAFPERYEFRPGESLAGLLSVANGGVGFPAHATDTVRVTRFTTPTSREVLLFSLADAMGIAGQAFLMQPFDAVYVPEIGDFMRQEMATVRGLVTRPGTYPIEPGVTTVRDLVQMAGGVLPDASLVNATLRRAEEAEFETEEEVELVEAPLDALSSQELRIRRARTLGDPQNVVVDLQATPAGEIAGFDQSLQPGDVLTVPRHRNEVVVLGAVGQPGILEYRRGRALQDYVQLAGGYSSRADRSAVTVLRGRLGTEASPRDIAAIEPGDQIIVPFREHMTIAERAQIVGGVASSLLAVVATYITVRQLFD